MTPATLRGLLPRPEVTELDNGLRIVLLRNPRVPLVATVLVYATGTRHDPHGHGGTAHFLEHMMFKGSSRFGPGAIDRETRALGGSNNAFTSHDSTLYYFTFAADRWLRALEIEADRMAALTLDPSEVDNERQVIVEEIAMYEGEPWDALDQAVASAFYGARPYGRPVLGTRDELAATDAEVLREFHRARYSPGNAVLVLAGAVEPADVAGAAERFGALSRRNGFAGRRPPDPAVLSAGMRRIVRRQGEVARLLLFLPAPPATDPDHPPLRLLATVLAAGRSSRLHRALVDDGQLCVWVAADLGETLDPGAVSIAAEVLPGVEPERVEATVLDELRRLRDAPPSDEEIDRARKIVLADWAFGHEKVDQQAMWVGTHAALFDLEHPWRYLDRELGADRDQLAATAQRYLDPDRRSTLGWSLPAKR